MAPELGPRLQALADRVPPEHSVADLGCDHALLAAALAAAGPGRRVIAADLAPGAVKMARATRARFGLGDRLDIRCGDGVGVLASGEAQCVVVAGVGGRTMLHMLALGGLEELGVARLVLQPQAAVGAVRVALQDAGWAFADECLVRDAERTYVILVSTRPTAHTRDLGGDLDAEFGPWIRHRPDPLFEGELDAEATRLEFLIERMRTQGAPVSRVQAFEERRARLGGERARLERLGRGS